jgi:type I restriction enzyme, S subunit
VKSYQIGDLFDLEPGFAFKSKDFKDKGIPVLKIKNVKANAVQLHNLSYVDEDFLQTRPNKIARKEDLLITMSGNRHDGTKETWVGKVAEFRHDGQFLINQRVGALRLKSGIAADVRCCGYFLSSDPFQYEFIAIATSSGGQANLSPAQILGATLFLPKIGEQKAIASVLGALDDKIENNRRTNDTLEEMARAIFKSWFVDFDPVRAKAEGKQPAHMDAETAALFPSAFGDDGLPVGWTLGTYNVAMAIYDAKRIPLSKRQREQRQGEFPYYGAAALMDHVDDYLFDGIFLLMGEDGSVTHDDGTPFLQYVWGKFWVNNHAHVLQGANGFSTEFLFCGLSSIDISSYVTGAVQAKLNQGNMKQMPLVTPTKEALTAFNDSVFPLFRKRRLNIEENETLAELRDTLLPKLMSGEIRAKDAEKRVEAVA